jgi:alpha-D-ribose 1-methylphosphonate 5-triphosphate synthase subunit PhnH
MTRDKVKQLREAIQSVINDSGIEDENQCKIRIGNASYSDSNCTLKIEVSDVTDDGTVLTKEAADFKEYAKGLGLKPEMLGATFESRGKEYVIAGLKPRSTKFPVLAIEVGTNDRYKFPVSVIQLRLSQVA